MRSRIFEFRPNLSTVVPKQKDAKLEISIFFTFFSREIVFWLIVYYLWHVSS